MVPFVGWCGTSAKWTNNALHWTKIGDFFTSPGGLKFLNSDGLINRLGHVMEHVKDNLTKPKHGIFDDPQNVVATIDEAWKQIIQKNIQGVVQTNGNTKYIYDFGSRIGWEGGFQGAGKAVDATKIQIIIRTGTFEVVTAFPIK